VIPQCEFHIRFGLLADHAWMVCSREQELNAALVQPLLKLIFGGLGGNSACELRASHRRAKIFG
jgi:hypothetical protein